MITDVTPNLELPLPHPSNELADDVTRLRNALLALDSAVAAKIEQALVGAANGLAVLDGTGRVPAAQLPSYVDDVLEFATFAEFPGIGEAGKIYASRATNKIYRWSGTTYTEISPSPGSTDAVIEGVLNLYFTAARAAAAAPVQSVNGKAGAVLLGPADFGIPNTQSALEQQAINLAYFMGQS